MIFHNYGVLATDNQIEPLNGHEYKQNLHAKSMEPRNLQIHEISQDGVFAEHGWKQRD
jgi:hypothetical protein